MDDRLSAEEPGGTETSDIGAAAAPGRERRMTAGRKRDAVLRLLAASRCPSPRRRPRAPHPDPVAEPRGPGGATGATAAKPADGHAVTDQAIVADHRSGMDHDAVLMGDPETAADMGAVGELDALTLRALRLRKR